MRVLFNALQAGNRSGTGRYAAELLAALAAQPGGIKYGVVWPLRHPVPPLGDADVFPLDSRPLRRLPAEMCGFPALRGFKPDLLHYPANVGALRSAVPVVLTIHDLSFLRHPEWFTRGRALYYRAAVRRTAARAAHIIADSQATADDVLALLKVPQERITVVPLGVSAAFHPAPAEAIVRARVQYQLPPRYFLYAGTIEPRKNLERLIAAFDHVAHTFDLDLVIAGRGGWHTRPVEAAAAAARHRARIHFPGYIAEEDLPAVLSAAHAFLWPSLFEGFGLPVLEAMACGTPVLTASVSSLPEVAGDAALLVNPRDMIALAEAIKTLAADAALRRDLAERGFRRAAQFTWAACAEKTISVYRSRL
jgi:glycosyltransferase involved in cell wall biosynthesis